MGSDIGVIIPSSFKEVRNKKKAEAFLLQMAEHLRKVLRIESISTSMNDDYCNGSPLKDEWPEYLPQIWVPEYGSHIYLQDGFWCMFNGFRYHQLVYPPGTQWLRHDIFDIVRALGQKEAWYCSEYDIEDREDYSLASWLEKASDSEDGIVEYDLTALIQEGKALWETQKRYYHDTFNDVFPLFEKMEKAYLPARLLGLYCGTEGMVRVETEGKVIRMPAQFSTH